MEYVLHPKSEIDSRIKKLQSQMGDLTGAILLDSVNLGYFSGTSQEGLIYVPRDSSPVVKIRKSLPRAIQESPLQVEPQKSLKTLKEDLDIPAGATIGLELDVLPYNNYARIASALGDVKFIDVSERIKHIRSVKSEFEIGLIKEAARDRGCWDCIRLRPSPGGDKGDRAGGRSGGGDALHGPSGHGSFPQVQPVAAHGPPHVGAECCRPQLRGFADGRSGHLPVPPPGAGLKKDKAK